MVFSNREIVSKEGGGLRPSRTVGYDIATRYLTFGFSGSTEDKKRLPSYSVFKEPFVGYTYCMVDRLGKNYYYITANPFF